MDNHYNCIYMYINKINGHKYVGQAKNFSKRCKEHLYESRNKNRNEYNLSLSKAIRKYGIENFEIKILAENIESQEKINEYEIFFIKRYKTLKIQNGYNIANGGHNGNPYEGKTEDEMDEIKRKISKKLSGKNHPNYGKHYSEETKQKMKEAWNDERKQKISEKMKGKPKSEEHKRKLSEAHKGKTHSCSEETKIKISQANKGKKVSKEAKQKMSENHSNVKGKNNPKARKIEQYDLDGNLIKVWDYIKQASKELTICEVSICNCCKGKQKTAGGFIWKYYKEIE